MLPTELARSVGRQWPCRDIQIKQLASLLSPYTPSPSTLVVHGISATCKSTIVRAVLTSLEVPHTIVRSTECITGRHLLTKILWGTLEALGLKSEWVRFGKGKCDHVNSLAVLLGECLLASRERERERESGGKGKFVLVLDGIEKQREASHTLLSALARLGELVPSLRVVLILSSTPRPLFLQAAAVPHVSFPPYTREEAITIILNLGPPTVSDDDGLRLPVTAASLSKIYAHFVSTVHDTLIGPTASTIPIFRSMCEKLWPQFISPIVQGEIPPGDSNTEWDFSRLLLRNRSMFRRQGESALVHHIVPPEFTTTTTTTTTTYNGHNTDIPTPPPQLPSLPYVPTLVLTSAYLAAHIPPTLDTVFFSKFSSSSLSARNKRAHHRRRLKRLSQPRIQAQADNNDTNDNNEDQPSTPRGGGGGGRRKSKRPNTRITKSTLHSAFATGDSGYNASTSGFGYGYGGGGGGGIGGGDGIAGLITARPFPLERLMAIYHAIDPNPPTSSSGGLVREVPVADAVYGELATLRRLRLVVPVSGSGSGAGAGAGAGARGGSGGGGGVVGGGSTSVDVGERWCVNVSGGWVGELARGIGVEVGEWLAGGLD